MPQPTQEVPMCYSPPGEGFGMAALNPETEIAYVSNLSKHGIGDYTGKSQCTTLVFEPQAIPQPSGLLGALCVPMC